MRDNFEILKGKKILLVDDDITVLDMYQRHLFPGNADTVTARDGKTGLEIALSVKPDVIVTNILMPSMNGIELVEKLQANTETKDIPIMVISALNNPEVIKKLMDSGAKIYLDKVKTTPEEVIDKIIEILQQKMQRAVIE